MKSRMFATSYKQLKHICVLLFIITLTVCTSTESFAGLTVGTNCGFVTVAPSADPEGPGTTTHDEYAYAGKFTSPADMGTVTEIGIYIVGNAGSAPDWEVGIYDHDSGNDRAGNLLGSTGPVAITASANTWEKQSGLSISLSPSTIYWIVTQVDNDVAGAITIDRDATQTSYRRGYQSASTLPDPFGAFDGTFDGVYAHYALYTPAASGASQVIIISP